MTADLPTNDNNPIDTAPDDDTLAEALARYEIVLPPEQIVLLDRYSRLLWDWNTRINLTRHTTYDKFVGRDVVDTLVIASHLQPGERVLDLGSGGGVPGLSLAILRPDIHVTLSEATGKKARVLDDLVAQLALPVSVYHGRAETALGPKARFDTVTVRAVAAMDKLLTWFQPAWPYLHRMLIVKGPAWVEERHIARQKGLLQPFDLRKLAEWPIPHADHNSVLLQITPKKPTAKPPKGRGRGVKRSHGPRRR